MSATPSSSTADSTSDKQPRKKMRRGTHSCAECRRRKKSCIPHPDNRGICTECHARNAPCRDQQPSATVKRPAPDSKQNLQLRVAELETALQSIVTRLGPTSGTKESADDATKTLQQLRADIATPKSIDSSSIPSPDNRLDNAPVLSLFDNSILSRFEDGDDDGRVHAGTSPLSEADAGHPSKADPIRRTLLALFPSQDTLDAVLRTSLFWWQASQAMFPHMYGFVSGSDVNQFVGECKASGSVQKIAKALLCISISLQEARPGSDLKLGPSETVSDLTTRYLDVIHELVISDDAIVGNIDGIECLFLHAKHDMNDGRIQRAWITTRRGISFSQLLGLQVMPKNTRPSAPEIIRKQSLWKALYHADRFLSLLLGLPYAISEIHSPISAFEGGANVDEKTPIGELYLLKLSHIIGHVIDRNQEPPSNNTLPLTVKIEGEMADLAASMPTEWWAKDLKPGEVGDQMYGRILPQFWYHQARTLLHLPFMLKAASDRRYEYNKIAALESAREMIHSYRTFRPVQGFASLICKVIDFQVFTAAMVLVLNLLGTPSTSSAHDRREAAEDEDLIAITQDILHRASLATEAGVTTQAARALEMFCKTRAKPCPPGQTTARIVIPYFGTVAFERGKSFANQAYLPSQANPQPTQLPTPEIESLNGPIQDPSGLDFSEIPPDLNFSGFQLQPPQSADDNGNPFANVNLDLDHDWSWFWDNTDMI